MMKKRLIIGLMGLIGLTGLSAEAQNGFNLPYSQYGLGVSDLPYNMPSAARMGGVVYTRHSNNTINPFNPASYGSIENESFVFDMGSNLQRTRLRSGDEQATDADGNIRIRGGDCTQVDTDAAAGSIRISNPCSRPCCGSASQEQLSSAIAQLETAQRRLSEYYQALTNNVNAVQARLASLIAAK
jgi:hypothetical protein